MIIKSVVQNLEFAKDTFYDMKLYEKMVKLKKKEIEIELNGCD